MTVEVLLIRHGESLTNVRREFSYRLIDHGLTRRGKKEALCSARWLCEHKVSEIYSSPLNRAIETATIMAKTLDIKVVVLEALREVDVGLLEGHSNINNWRLHDQIITAWKHGFWDIRFPMGESFAVLVNRARTALIQMMNAAMSKRIAAVTHGAMLLAIRYGLCGETVTIDTPTASITPIFAHENPQGVVFRQTCQPIVCHIADLDM